MKQKAAPLRMRFLLRLDGQGKRHRQAGGATPLIAAMNRVQARNRAPFANVPVSVTCQAAHETATLKEAESIKDEASDWVDDSEFEGQVESGETFSLRTGASVNSQKKLIPKSVEKMPLFESRGAFEEVRSKVVDWMKANPTAATPDGKTILIINPAGGSLERRAEHWMGSYAKDDAWRRDGRSMDKDKIASIASIAASPTTISGAQAEALALTGKTVYLRRYADGKLHAVFVDRENRVTEHGLIDGSVVTQCTLDPRKGIEGAKIGHDWTTESPAYSVNPVKGAESDRVMTPGPQPMDQRNDTPSPSAQGQLTAEGDIVNAPETMSLRSGDFAARAAAMFSPFMRTPEARMMMGGNKPTSRRGVS